MKIKLALGAIGFAALLTAPLGAASNGVDVQSGRYAIGISGYVPVICRATVDAQMVQGGSLGSLREFCNSPSGYRVVAQYSPELATGALVVDGNAIALPESGEVEVASSNTAAINTRSLSLELPEGVTDGAISFRIETR